MDSRTLKRIGDSEHLKYAKLFAGGYGATGYQRLLSEYIQWVADPSHKILDMGCGLGIAVFYLKMAKYNAFGVDITLAGVRSNTGTAPYSKVFTEAPLWALPFKDKEFDYTFSADVLEHMPPTLIKEVVMEIYRVTNKQTFHVVSTQPSGYKKGLHSIIKPLNWWRKLFKSYNERNIKFTVVDCAEFLVLHKKKAKEMEREVKCTCDRLFENEAKMLRHLEIHKTDPRHVPDLEHYGTKITFKGGLNETD